MMSITTRSRILAAMLAVAMILSLVPVMAVAEGDYSVDYLDVTYPAGAETNYNIKTTFRDADGNPAEGTVAVRVYAESNINDLFYYNMFEVEDDGAIDLTLNMINTDPQGKYWVEFINSSTGDRNYGYYYFMTEGANDAFNADVAAALEAHNDFFTDVAIQQKVSSLKDDLRIYADYILDSKLANNETFTKIKNEIKAKRFAYTNDDKFISDVENATLLSLFKFASTLSRDDFEEVLADADVWEFIDKIDSDDKLSDYKEKYENAGITVQGMIREELRTYTFTSLSDIPSKIIKAVDKITTTKDDKDSGSSSSVSVGTSAPVVIPPVVSVTNIFTDIDANQYWWLIEPLQALYTNGYINGRTPNTFAPGESITRAEFLKILLMELDMVNAAATESFDDVSASDWFYKYVASGASQGIVLGKSGALFMPNDLITREEICVMTMRAVRAKAINLGVAGVASPFTDEASISQWAISDVHALKEAAILSGRDNGAFDPAANATRAEAVKILYGVFVKK